MPRGHSLVSQGDPTPATTPQCWQVWGLMVGARESGGWAPQVLQQALSGCCETWGQAGARAGLSAALAGKLVSTRVWVCGRVCVHDYIFYVMLTEGSLTGPGDLCNWERATEHLWAHVPICWGGDRARRSCGACTEHVSLAGLNPTFWDGRRWTGIKSSSERQGLALLELVETRVHTCVQRVTLSRGVDLGRGCEGPGWMSQCSSSTGSRLHAVSCSCFPHGADLPDLGQEAVFPSLQICWHSLSHLSSFVSAVLPDREVCGITCGVCGITCGMCGITCVLWT